MFEESPVSRHIGRLLWLAPGVGRTREESAAAGSEVARLPSSPFGLGWFAGASAVGFALTTLLVRASGLVPVLPWGMVLLLTVLGVPFCVSLQGLSRAAAFQGWPACLAAGVAVLYLWQNLPIVLLLGLGACLLPAARPRFAGGRQLLLACVTMVCGYGVVWNLNYLLMRHMPLFRWDPYLRAADLWFYSLWFGPIANLNGYFPLVHNPVLVRLLDSAYSILFPEILLIAFLLCQAGDEDGLTRYLRRLFGYYAAGIAVYALFPVNGPHLYYPEQIDLARLPPSSLALSNGMLHDYEVAKTGGQLAGFGYFIAFPSLHVLAAVFLQHTLWRYPILFRIFLPINAALCLSTVLLGYHYLLDSVGSVALYAISLAWRRRKAAV